MAAQISRAAAAEPSLLKRCFAPEALTARPSERLPVRGASGSNPRIPPLPVADAVTPAAHRGAIRRVTLPPGKKLVALTLDLCEQPGEIAGYDGAIFDWLRTNRIKATVFTGGKWMATHAERTRQLLADPLLELASHGWAHRNVRGLTGQDLTQELLGPEAAFQMQRAALASSQCVAAGGAAATSTLLKRLALYRFPYGACNAAALDTLASRGMLAIQWDVSTGDASPAQSADAIARTMAANVRPGSIILAHANGRGHNTAAALPKVIPALQAQGYSFVTVSELIAAGKPVVTDTCYDAKVGDTDRYDRVFAPRRVINESR